jgi:hypothetical protein
MKRKYLTAVFFRIVESVYNNPKNYSTIWHYFNWEHDFGSCWETIDYSLGVLLPWIVSGLYAQELGPGHTIVTILCDSGMQHLSKFFNDRLIMDWLQQLLVWNFWINEHIKGDSVGVTKGVDSWGYTWLVLGLSPSSLLMQFFLRKYNNGISCCDIILYI